jgi:hypothetical protein
MASRRVPRYVEQACFRMRGNGDFIKWLTEAYPDTMRWISYTIDTTLANMRSVEIQKAQEADRGQATRSRTQETVR